MANKGLDTRRPRQRNSSLGQSNNRALVGSTATYRNKYDEAVLDAILVDEDDEEWVW